MRGLALLGTFLGLLAGLYGLWQHRFERSAEMPTFRLADLRETNVPVEGFSRTESGIRLRFVRPDSPVVALMEFPGVPPVDFLNVRFHLKASDLALGRDFWDDGRLIIDWIPAGGGPVENDAVHSVRWDDPGVTLEFVMRPKEGPAVPRLRLEHRGRRGEFELTLFEATVLRETTMWKFGKWLVLAGWLGWAYAVILSFGVKHRFRALLAAAVWVTLGIYFVVPGPWKNQRSMISPFELGPEISAPRTSVPSTPAAESAEATAPRPGGGPSVSVGKIPVKGDLALRIKFHLVRLRPFLHTLLLGFPAFVISVLAGWRPALLLSVVFGLSIEAAQIAFGYGFDGIDAWDLVSDAFGIACGLMAAWPVKRWLHRLTAKNVPLVDSSNGPQDDG